MKCPECKKAFDPWAVPTQKVGRKRLLQCPHCKEWVRA